jgi:hypothetical protein
MDKITHNRLEVLILQSKNMTSDSKLNEFAITWRNFLDELAPTDKEIAIEAYFKGIHDTLDLIEQDVKEVSKNGSEKDRQDYAKGLGKMKELLKPKPDTVAI